MEPLVPRRVPRLASRLASRLALALALWALSSGAVPLSAFDLAGVAPEAVFAGDEPAYSIEMLNDSNAFSTNRVESDDIRSYGLEAYGSWRGFALGIDYEGFTFRGDPPEGSSRDDELALSAAWMSSQLGDRAASARFGLGGGLRAWGDFGLEGVQRFWHGVLGVERPFPENYEGSYLLPFGYAAADARLAIAEPFAAKTTLHLLAVAPGGIESSIALLGEAKSRASENWAGLRRQDRFGAFSACDDRANAYEGGTWLVWGMRTGLLSMENSTNADIAFSLGTMTCRFGGNEEANPSGPREELALGTVLVWSAFSASRFLVIESSPEIHAGIEALMGLSKKEWNDEGSSRYEEGLVAVEAFAGTSSSPRPFVGLAGGLRQDTWEVTELQRSTIIARRVFLVGNLYGGLRLFELPFSRRADGGMALDLGGILAFVSGGFLPPVPGLFLRLAATDPR